MVELVGKAVCSGIAIGKMKYYVKEENRVQRINVQDIEHELKRYEAAKETGIQELKELYEKAVISVGEENARIFHGHAMILEDAEYNSSVTNIISSQSVNAEYAVAITSQIFQEKFANMEADYFKEKSADIKDIFQRLLRILSGVADSGNIGDEPVILLAEDLTPSEIVQMDKSVLLAVITKYTSSNSHTVILARSMGIPVLTGMKMDSSYEGRIGIVDGFEGKLIVDPDAEVLEAYVEKKMAADDKKALLPELKGRENVTKSGRRINIYANIGSTGEIAAVLANDADGIGLFRSEVLYLERDTFPTEEQQFEVYRKVLETMGEKKVIIRTLDIGADKQADYFNFHHEENPALGYRGIRICLSEPDIFRTQLRALFRASAYGNLAIMYPMIISVDEVREIKAISKAVRKELLDEGVRIGNVEEGIMIETPAAAIMSDELAKEVDFFSIGTNDLTQYTLAVDRQNPRVERFNDMHHPAILRLIKMVCDNGHKAGIRIGICGELGADTSLTEEFLKMGIDELSVSPDLILQVRKVVREI